MATESFKQVATELGFDKAISLGELGRSLVWECYSSQELFQAVKSELARYPDDATAKMVWDLIHEAWMAGRADEGWG